MELRDVAVIGGGPGGLLAARLLKLANPSARVVVYERNPVDATFGFGVGFSRNTLAALVAADPEAHAAILSNTIHGSVISFRHGGQQLAIPGYALDAISRATLLSELAALAADAGVDVRDRTEVTVDQLGETQLVVAADGVNSTARQQLAEHLQVDATVSDMRYMWLGTTAPLEGPTFLFADTAHGLWVMHAYPFTNGASTAVIEGSGATWRAAGFSADDARELGPGESDLRAKEYLESVFSEHLGGHRLLTNNSKWMRFSTIRCARWSHGNVVFLGDAIHTAHYSLGSGTKLALEDAISLAQALSGAASLEEGFAQYEAARRPAVERLQRWAERSERWWESVGPRLRMPLSRLALNYLMRTGALGLHDIERDAAEIVEQARRDLQRPDGWAVELPWSDKSDARSFIDLGAHGTSGTRVLQPEDHDGQGAASEHLREAEVRLEDPDAAADALHRLNGDQPIGARILDAPADLRTDDREHLAKTTHALRAAGASWVTVDCRNADREDDRTLPGAEVTDWVRHNGGLPAGLLVGDADDGTVEAALLAGRLDFVVRHRAQ